MKFNIILLLLIIGYLNSNAQDGKWFLEFNDGKVIEAKMHNNGFNSNTTQIPYINISTNKGETAPSVNLAKITSVIKGDTVIYTKRKFNYKVGKPKFWDRLCWSSKIYGTDKMEIHRYFKLLYRDDMAGIARATTQYTALAFMVPSQGYLNYLAPYSETAEFSSNFHSKYMNRLMKIQLKKACPEFAKGLKKLSYMNHEFRKIVDDYTAACR